MQVEGVSGSGQPKAQSPTAALKPRDEKPWVAERWGNDKDIPESKWGQDSPFGDRGNKWAEDERRERVNPGASRRDGPR
jgi:hypothetical protein